MAKIHPSAWVAPGAFIRGDVTLAGVFHGLVHAAPGYEQLRLKGLNPDATYRVTSMGQALRIGQFGALLKHVVPVNINPNGMLMRVVDNHFTMKDNAENITASGAALMSGMMLRPLFRGTGYSEEQRTQGDFGSDIYVVEDITE